MANKSKPLYPSLGPGRPRFLWEPSAFLNALASLRGLSRRRSRTVAVMMLEVNAGGKPARSVSAVDPSHRSVWFETVLAEVFVDGDVVARFSGQRYAVAFSEGGAEKAREAAARCRRAMRARPLPGAGRTREMSLRAGIAESTVGFVETEHQLVHRAQLALDRATRRGPNETAVWSELPEAHASQRLNIDGISRWAARLREDARLTGRESMRALVAAVEAKDPYTRSHSQAVADCAEAIGRRMNLSPRLLETIRTAALLHDVGKIGVPDAILTKPGPLSDDELAVIRRHPQTAVDILEPVSLPGEERAFILHHHERYDGQGYPAGLRGEQIPIGARVLAVADAVDTMRSPRTYKKPYPIEHVRKELRSHAGRQFDPTIVEAALVCLDETPASPERPSPD